MLHMEDEAGGDAKILAVPTTRSTPLYQEVHDHSDIARSLRDEIAHFSEQYKALEDGKRARVDHWSGVDGAKGGRSLPALNASTTRRPDGRPCRPAARPPAEA